MILHSPLGAMLWENWRLTRVEMAQRLGLGVLGGAAALQLMDDGTHAAFWIVFVLNAFIYMSVAKLNGGRFLDGYKPGFPFHLLYTRPVRTSVLVGVAAAYDTLTAVALYLVTIGVLMLLFGQQLPLLPIAALIVALHVVYICIQWSTRSRTLQWIGSMVIFLPVFWMLKDRVPSPQQIRFSASELVLMLAICVVSFVLTVAGVARQRRGEVFASGAKPAGASGYPDWLVSLFRVACPTSSPLRAQLWLELRASGLPALAIGVAGALLIAVLFALAIPFAFARPVAMSAVMLFAPALLLLLGGNAFGIRRRQGRAYASAFEITQPLGTARMAGLKLAVRTACTLVAMVMVGASVWFSSALLGAWGSWVVEGGKDAVPEFLKVRQNIGHGFDVVPAYALAAFSLIGAVSVTTTIALFATFTAIRARYPRHVLFAGAVMVGHGLLLIMLAIAGSRGIVPASLVLTAFAATGWFLIAGIVLATLYLFWTGFVERALTISYTSVALVISAAFAATWVVILQKSGVTLAGMSAAGIAGLAWPMLLPPLVFVAAPWSLGRLRHM
ncbi:MAG TPA: hypothetical protein VF033_08095 [Steroidobacteraceae bacterium]